MCAHALNGGALICDRTTTHNEQADGGHTYSAAWAADRHDASEASDD